MSTRSSNFELLRIIAILLIIIHHYSVHTIWGFQPGLQLDKFFIETLAIGGKVGVYLFVIITGYFMIGQRFKVSSVLSVLILTWFYSIIFVIIELLAEGNSNLKDIALSSTPFGYWFVNSYVSLILLSPFINELLRSLSPKRCLNFILIIGGLAIMPLLNQSVGEVTLFVMMYSIGAYLKIYKSFNSINGNELKVITCCVFVIALSIALFEVMSEYTSLFSYTLYFAGLKSPFVILISVSLFSFFKNLPMKNNTIINSIAATTFGIYLIHDNRIVRGWLWPTAQNAFDKLSIDSSIFKMLVTVFVVFFMCTLIEFLRSFLVKLLNLNNVIENVTSKVEKKHAKNLM